MNQRRCKINVKDRGEEHKMYDQSQSKKQQHIQNELSARETKTGNKVKLGTPDKDLSSTYPKVHTHWPCQANTQLTLPSFTTVTINIV